MRKFIIANLPKGAVNISSQQLVEVGGGGGGGTGAVDSVNGKTGVVVLDADDLGAEDASNKKSTVIASTTEYPNSQAVIDYHKANSSIKRQITDGYEYFNDFEGIVASGTNDSHFFFATASSGSINSSTTINSGLIFSTEGSNNATIRAYSRNSGTANCDFTFVKRLRVNQLANITDKFYVALGQALTASTYTTGIYFAYDKYDSLGNGSTNDNWICVCRIGGLITAVDSGIAVDTVNLQKLEIQVNNLAEAKFYINNILKATITTNIYSSQLLRIFGLYKTLGITAVTLDTDYIYTSIKYLTPRL